MVLEQGTQGHPGKGRGLRVKCSSSQPPGHRKNLRLHDRTLQSSGGEVPAGSLPWVRFSGTQSKEEFWGLYYLLLNPCTMITRQNEESRLHHQVIGSSYFLLGDQLSTAAIEISFPKGNGEAPSRDSAISYTIQEIVSSFALVLIGSCIPCIPREDHAVWAKSPQYNWLSDQIPTAFPPLSLK